MKSHTETYDHLKSTEDTSVDSSKPPLPGPSIPEKGEDLKILIEKNIKWSQVIYHQNRKIQRRLSWMVFGSYFRLFLILVPLILGFIFLPSLITDFMNQYGSSLDGGQQNLQDYLQLFRSGQ